METFKSPTKPLIPSRLIIGSCCLVILISLSGYFFVSQKFSLQSFEEETVENLARTEIVALGRIEPEGEVIKIAPSSSLTRNKVDQLLIQEGESVQAGQIIAILDTVEVKKAAEDFAQKQLQVSMANLEIVKAGAKQGAINAQKASIKSLEAQLQGKIKTNNANINRLKAQLKGDKESQKATIERLKAELDNASSEFKRYEYLAQEGVISQSDLDQRRLTVITTQKKLKEAQAHLSRTKSTLEQQIASAQAQAEESKLTLLAQIQQATSTLNQIAEVRNVNVSQAEATVEQMKAGLKQAQADLELAYVKAPISGQILKIITHAGEEIGSDGIAFIGKTSQMYAVAEVYETDIGLVEVGQSATISSPAFSEPILGTVSYIGKLIFKNDLLADDPAADSDARVVEVKIRLENKENISQLTNIQVDVHIQLNQSK